MKKFILVVLWMLTLSINAAFACEVCKQNQPEPLQNITHGTGPQGEGDYIIISAGIVIVSITLFYSLKFLIRPGEKDPGHIKNIVVDETY